MRSSSLSWPLALPRSSSRVRPSRYEIAKRRMDVILAISAMVLLAPLGVLVALLVWLEDGGPILFTQVRVGEGGRRFRIFKFRTMVLDAERLLPHLIDIEGLEEPVFKLEHDPRVTRVGRVLRRWSLDEIPQLLNVLRGEMSIVGPRPEEWRLVARYSARERRRLRARPGITGLQQIQCRGSVRIDERLRWDLIYLRRRNIRLDIMVCLQTVYVVLAGRGAV